MPISSPAAGSREAGRTSRPGLDERMKAGPQPALRRRRLRLVFQLTPLPHPPPEAARQGQRRGGAGEIRAHPPLRVTCASAGGTAARRGDAAGDVIGCLRCHDRQRCRKGDSELPPGLLNDRRRRPPARPRRAEDPAKWRERGLDSAEHSAALETAVVSPGLPGAMQCHSTHCFSCHLSMAFQISSVPAVNDDGLMVAV